MSDFGPVLVAAFGDTHFGGTVALMSPDPIALDDGGTYVPSERIGLQLWRWWNDWWDRVEAERERLARIYGPTKLVLLCNGDLFEGDHHQTHQIVQRHRGVEGQIAASCWDVPLSLGPDQIYITRGTESHVGAGAGSEEAFASALAKTGRPVVPNPDVPERWTAYHWQLDVGPWRLWAHHHGSMGQTPRTKASLAALRTADVWIQAMLDNWRWEQQGEEPDRIPDVVVGSHYHQWAESAPSMFPTHGVQLPCWTYSNAHAQKVAARTLPDIGGALIRCLPDRPRPEVEPVIYKPRRSTPCRI